jgi:ATP-dependent exoDNAse (exonuclease V) alpha subunit
LASPVRRLAILETLNQQVFLGKPGILEGGTVTCNGDIGYLRDVEPDDRELIAIFDGRELATLVPAYAATIHKSRGSEYPAMVIPV